MRHGDSISGRSRFGLGHGLHWAFIAWGECYTMVLHRHFPAVREMPDFEGLLRC
jgi:hypothetical protein